MESLHLPAPDLTDSPLLAVHRRPHARGSWVVDEAHWDGLTDGSGPKVTREVVRDFVHEVVRRQLQRIHAQTRFGRRRGASNVAR